MNMDHRKLVVELVREYDAKIVAEIGVWQGHLSGLLFRLDLERLILVDPFWHENPHCSKRKHEQSELDAMHKALCARMPSFAVMMRCESLEAADLIEDGSVDFVFIDADHERIEEDIDAWLPKVKKGGVISGDDFSSPFPKIVKAVKERFPHYSNVGRVWHQQV